MDDQSKLIKEVNLKKRELKANQKLSNGAIINDIYIQDTAHEKNQLKDKIN